MRALWYLATLAGLLAPASAAQIPAAGWVRVNATQAVSLSVPPGTTRESISWDDAAGAKLRGPGFELLLYYGGHGLAEEKPYQLCTSSTVTDRINGKKSAVIALRDSSKPRLPYFVGLCMPEANIDTAMSVYFTDSSGRLSLRAEYLKLIVLGYAADADTAERIKLIYQTVQFN